MKKLHSSRVNGLHLNVYHAWLMILVKDEATEEEAMPMKEVTFFYEKGVAAAHHKQSSGLGDGQTMLGISQKWYFHICSYTCNGQGIKICPIFNAKWLCGAHMCIGARVDVQYIAFLLLSIFE